MKNLFTALLLMISLSAIAQKNDPVIIEINEKEILKSEFETIFKKNNTDDAITQESLDEYLELFINYKLKVKEAEAMGMDTLKHLSNELRGYRKQLAQPYLSDNSMSEELIKEAYDRLQKEVKAKHILIRVDLDADPEDSLKAYNRILEIRKEILNGADFETIAKKKSEDPSAQSNGGNLGYFSGLRLVYPFETAAYNTPAGEISEPVRTRFGYHIILVDDIRPSRGEVKVAHILIQSNPKASEDRRKRAKMKAEEIYEKVTSGEEEFEAMAQKYSDDKQTGRIGGVLPMFGPGRMVPEFEEAAFSLDVDEISEPVRTDYGWHIIKKLEHKKPGTFEEMKREIESKVAKDSRSKLVQESFIEGLKEEYNFTIDKKNLKEIADMIEPETFKPEEWEPKLKKKHSKNAVISFADQKVTQKDFVEHIQQQKIRNKIDDAAAFINQLAEDYGNAQLLEYEESILEDKYDEFRILLNEYRDGILLFEITDRKVWSKSLKDTVGLQEFYEENKDNFMWPERVDGVIFTCKTEDIAKKAKKKLKKGKYEDVQGLLNELNEKSTLNIKRESGKFKKEDHEVLGQIKWKEGISEIISHNDQFVFVQINEVLPEAHKTLDEARGLVASQYQTVLEENWIQELRDKHTIKVHKDVLYSIE